MLRRLALVVALALAGSGCAYRVDIAAPAAQAETTKVFAADGSLITTLHAEQDREEVPLTEMAPVLKSAVLAIEDSRFFTHKGVDLRALARALRRNAEAGEVLEGGSTITQQYVKNVLLDSEKTVSRKVREAVLAVQLERTHTKEAILEGYLNRIYFGNGAYGVQAASSLYFNKAASALNLAEAALLAGLIQAPESYDPFSAAEAALARRQVVLGRLRELGWAPEADVAAAEAAPLGVAAKRPSKDRYPAGYFVERVKRFVLDDERFGPTPADRRRLLFEEGLRIRTTVDLRIQQAAEEAVKAVLPNPATDPSGAVVVLDPRTGFVRALVGGRDFFGPEPEAKFDLATQGMRQTGSSFKPIVLAEALAQGIPPERVYEAPGTLTVPMPDGQEPWVVRNYEGDGGPPLSLADATVSSINTVYAKLIEEVGPQKAIDMAHNLGIAGPLQPFPSAVLGSNEVSVLDMASAYSTFAADGMHADPVFVTEITRADGSVLYRRPSTLRRAIPTAVARGVTSILSQVVQRGTGTAAQLGARPVAGKTGTANEWRDAWFVGYTPELVAAVWVGFPERLRSMVPPATPIRVTGGSRPAQIWHRAMAPALADSPITAFPAPEPVIPQERIAATTPASEPAGVTLPDVRGQYESQARAVLEAAGFKVETERRPTRERASGMVADQTPAPGTLVGPGGTVVIGVSSGPPRPVVIANTIGLSVDQAARLLQVSGLAVEIVVEDPPEGTNARPGRVWKQTPDGGAVVDEGQLVRIWARR
ncbi:MAG: PBP1A family penicillin-binding protein [Actinomycetota bacterium]|jgi:penicillin-binding protein 1A